MLIGISLVVIGVVLFLVLSYFISREIEKERDRRGD